MDERKKISVLMGVFNCEKTVGEAIRSIQEQTYSNWELIICDDGSSDRTYETVVDLSKTDPRLIVIRNETNSGLNKTLNHCLEYASGEYIARMDGDDLCEPSRFEKQFRFLESQGEYRICSTAMYFFDENGIWGRNHVTEKPTERNLIAGSPICHAPVMMAKECMDTVHGYSEDRRTLRVEDVDLWIRLFAAGYRCCNLDEPLYGMRNDQNALNRRKFKYRFNSAYVRLKGCRIFRLPAVYYLKALMPVAYGLVPARVRHYIRMNKAKEK